MLGRTLLGIPSYTNEISMQDEKKKGERELARLI